MSSTLRLTLTDYVDPSRWRWVLEDSDGRFLADHDVRLDGASREYRGFLNLAEYLDYHQPIHPPAAQLAELGCWIGELLLEDDRGRNDTINAEELGELLERARERLQLLVLDTCYSGAASHAAARVQVGLDKLPAREAETAEEGAAETKVTLLPSLAQTLSQRLHCAALAMRYPVGDAFAVELTLSL